MTNELIGTQLGDFEIVRELGRGGMGVVYDARQVSLNRRVALKVLGPGLGLTPRAVERFRREATAAAKLHHTNIVPVYATGDERGIHFYAMELIDGPGLDAVVRQLREQTNATTAPAIAPELANTTAYTPPDPFTTLSDVGSAVGSSVDRFDRIAAMIAGVADALHHAHQNGVTHRDIKPSNLLLSSVDGRLSVSDFGLARLLEEPGMTVTGEFLGTPAYMSPEQVTTGRIPVDHRTDIYSLGATLYELLTLRPPFSAAGRDRLLAMVIQKEPAAARAVNPKVPRDLETICLKCLEKDPDRRYQSAKVLAEDLRRFINRFGILAKRSGPLARAKKWVKRNPALSMAVLAVFVALCLAGFFAWRAHQSELVRLAEKRREAIERGMVAALAADLAGAEKAVAEAELLGASAGATRMLRGFIAIHSGQSVEAVSHLELAVQLMPDQVAPRALLAVAYVDAGDWAEALRVLTDVVAMTPGTPEDKLFKGQAVATLKPDEGLRLMDEALAERPSTLGHLLRASARLGLAELTGTVATAETAVAAAETAKQLLPDNPGPLGNSCHAQLVAADAYERANDLGRAAEHLAAARREVEGLARFGLDPRAVLFQFDAALVFDGRDGKLDRTAELRAAREGRRHQLLTYYEAYNWLCLGNDRRAEAVASEFPADRLNGCVRVLAALGRPGGRSDGLRALEAFTGAGSSWLIRVEAAPLQFALDRARFLAAVKELSLEGDRLLPRELDERKRRLAFLEGTLSEAEYLNAPSRGTAELRYRHYAVAWKRLGEGDRDGARRAFEEAYRFKFASHHWLMSRAVLIRMKDPKWPQAILGKK